MGKSGPKARTKEEVLEHIKNNSTVNTVTGCKLWHGHKTEGGYGIVSWLGNQDYVHRLIYRMSVGPIPDHGVIRHSCDTPNCWEKSHLICGTHADNVNDKVNKGRHCFGEKHYRAKLTKEQVDKIRNEPGTYAELGRKYGVSRGGIYNIKNGTSWKT